MEISESFGFGFCTARYTCKSRNNTSRTLMYPYNDEIHKSVYMCAFKDCLSTVHHELGVFPCKDDQSVAPLGVPENTAPQ